MDKILLHITAQDDTPEVTVSESNGYIAITIKGISMPENTLEFYEPLRENFNSLINKDVRVHLIIQLDYMNSMSNKQIIKLIDQIKTNSSELKIFWCFEKGDDLMKIKGEECREIFPQLEFNTQEIT